MTLVAKHDLLHITSSVVYDLPACLPACLCRDNFYETGVESVEDKGWEDSYEKIYTGPSLQKRWFSVLGNHDYLGQTQAQIDYTQLSSRWFMPARYFTSSISTACARDGSASSVDFFFIDTTPMIDDYRQKPAYVSRGDVTKQDASLQLLWLDKALSDSKAEWKIVVGHHPVHSGALGGEKDLQKRLEPLLQKHGIQAYICGHDHDLQHIVYSTDGLVGGGAIHYVVSGAGSQTWPIFVGTQGVQWHSTQSGFMLLTLSSAKEMTLESFVWDGSNPYTATASIGER
mmetsp:Transcript_8121/g.13136  ORF Transcript_8121/g.13136 Transcript_8121/m.13136 type:complete len:286 (+) Transcript_8121:538-1395(+)